MAEINDGFGDALGPAEIDAYIRSNERLLRLKAAERVRGNTSGNAEWDDICQEARIVQFTVLTKRPSADRRYVSAAMSIRISEVLTRGTWTGMETRHGKPTDPIRRRDRDSVDDETSHVADIVDSSDWVDKVLIAYHHGEIMQALAALTFTQRAHVVARFWHGLSNAEIAARQGCAKQTVERQWRTEIRPRLLEQLGHLATL